MAANLAKAAAKRNHCSDCFLDYIGRMESMFSVTEPALTRIAHLLRDEPQGTYFRVSVLGGGCSGFQYHFDLSATPLAADDQRFGNDTIPVVVDETSLGLLQSAALDYVETIGSAAFEIKNPNAKASCGCGNSFSVAL